MRKLRFLSILLLAITFVFVNCTKEGPEGPVGGTGAQGPAGTNGTNGTNGAPGAIGPQGPVGPQGPAGTPGATGTANVIYSDWFQFALTDWIDTTMTNMGTTRRANKFTTTITQSIVNSGTVLAYFAPALPAVTAFTLPLTTATTPSLSITYAATNGRVIYLAYVNQTGGGAVNVPVAYGFRYVVIPGGVGGGRFMSGAAAGYSIEELKAMPYDKIREMFNIPSHGSNIP